MDEFLNPRLISIFYNKLVTEGKKNYQGLLYEISMHPNGGVILNFENPKDLSFSFEVLLGFKETLTTDFINLIHRSSFNFPNAIFKKLNDKIYVTYNGKEINKRIVYLNSEDLDTINRFAKSITIFKTNEFFSPCSTKFDYAQTDGENLNIGFDVKLLHPEYEGKPVKDLKELGEVLKELMEDDYTYDYTSYEFADSIMSFFWNNPLLMDTEYMFLTSNIDFFDHKNNNVKWWNYG